MGKGKRQNQEEPGSVSVLLFYAYVDLPDVNSARDAHEAALKKFHLDGRLRISIEGLNGNLSGHTANCEAYVRYLKGETKEERNKCGGGVEVPAELFGSLASCDFKVAPCGPEHCFRGLKVWVANEVTGLFGDQSTWTPELEAERVALAQCAAGKHLAPVHFHQRLSAAAVAVGAVEAGASSSTTPAPSADDPIPAQGDAVLFDARNIYETRVGRFEVPGVSFVDPGTRNFSELRSYFENEENLQKFKDKEVFMYCTGGVRCERSSALLRRAGVAKAVYQLHGGIQRYMEQFPSSNGEVDRGYFNGKMHVFDRRGCIAPDGTVGSTEVKCDRNTSLNTISRCALCSRLWDQYKGKRRCSNCGTLVLVCETCQSAGKDRREGSALRCELCPVDDGVDKTRALAEVSDDPLSEPAIAKKPRQAPNEDAAAGGS